MVVKVGLIRKNEIIGWKEELEVLYRTRECENKRERQFTVLL